MANKLRFHVFNDEKVFQEICFQLYVITIEDDCVLTNHVCLQKVKQPKANTKMNVPTNSSIRCYGGCASFKHFYAMFDDKKHGIVQGPVSTHAGVRPLF